MRAGAVGSFSVMQSLRFRGRPIRNPLCGPLSQSTLTKPLPDFTVPLPCFFPVCLVGTRQIPSGATKGVKKMGRHQTETYYQTEASYLKSVLLWLREYWTGPPVHVYPLRPVPQASGYYSARRTLAAPNRRGEIIDLPAFLPPRSSSVRRRGG
jgi:hypothetical protein